MFRNIVLLCMFTMWLHLVGRGGGGGVCEEGGGCEEVCLGAIHRCKVIKDRTQLA